MATVFGTDAGSQGDLPGVLTGLKAVGIKLADQENLTPDQPSYRSSAERLLAAKPAAIITESDGPTAATFFGELEQLGSLVPIIGTSGTPSDSYFSPLRGAIGDANFDKYFRAVVVGNPVANPAVTAFNKAVLAVQGKLAKPVTQWENNSFSESGYDAVITLALAMDAAKSTDGAVYNSYITQVTAPGPGKQVVYTYPAGMAALAAGHQIQYVGASGPILFNSYHNSFGAQAIEEFPAERARRGGRDDQPGSGAGPQWLTRGVRPIAYRPGPRVRCRQRGADRDRRDGLHPPVRPDQRAQHLLRRRDDRGRVRRVHRGGFHLPWRWGFFALLAGAASPGCWAGRCSRSTRGAARGCSRW